ncbi:GlsB/YeaQ/YmgE family stress response membrane protein [Oryzomicrobium sp.]|uniref:GlsB/YeaQ/YmgE family stress response membrane protein n=1 Tax=Oryzomicrobium sp. TaxID=1911578 RepID=UPI0025EBB039|nr:GlsB/YeaQ/YmgE family stress response membrane protein [Oryzomicrobium sp.]MCE1244763.1 GlsB/YeaQ/YmgE family stress response membrane protein [Oryzomicrobium sp.]
MGWIVTLLVGGLIGWVASRVMNTDAQQGIIANVLVGVVGSALGRWLFGDVIGIGAAETAGAFSLAGLAFGVLGAVVLVALLKVLGVFR